MTKYFFSKEILSKLSLRSIVLIGLLCRMIIAPFTTSFDFEDTRQISFLYKYAIGLGGCKVSSHQPPLWQLTLRAVYPIYLILSLSCESIFLERLILKMPIIISDVMISVILFRMFNKLESKSNTKLIALIWSLNPYSIWISSIWGKYDLIPTLLSVIALERLSSKQIKSSAFLLSIGIMYKLYLLYLIPAFLIPLYRFEGREKVIEYSKIVILSCTVLTVFWNISLTELRGAISPAGFHPTISYWYAFVILLIPLENAYLASINLMIGIVILIWHFFRRKIEEFSIYELNYNVLMAFMLIYLERLIIFMYHIVWSLPFILISCFGAKEIPKRIVFLFFLTPILWILCWNPFELFTNLLYEWWCFESIQKALGMNFSLLCVLIIAYLIKKKSVKSKNDLNKKSEKRLTFLKFANFLALICGIFLVIDSLILNDIWLTFWNTIMKYAIFYSTITVLSFSLFIVLLNIRKCEYFSLKDHTKSQKISVIFLLLLWIYNAAFILANIKLPFLHTISSQIVTQSYAEPFFSYLLILWIPLIVYSMQRAQSEAFFSAIYIVFLQIDFLITRHYYTTLQNTVVQIDLLVIFCVLIPLLFSAVFANRKKIQE